MCPYIFAASSNTPRPATWCSAQWTVCRYKILYFKCFRTQLGTDVYTQWTLKLKTLLKIWLFKRVKKFCKVLEHKCLVPLQVVLSSSAYQKYWKQTLFFCFLFSSTSHNLQYGQAQNYLHLEFFDSSQSSIIIWHMALLVSSLGWH